MAWSSQSPSTLRQKLKESFQDKIPGQSNDLQIGYIARRRNGKRWIENDADLSSVYAQLEHSTSITLFCEGCLESTHTAFGTTTKPRKRKSSYDDHEEQVQKLATELEEKHGDKYNYLQVRLWARMVVNNQHDSMEGPPNIPIITGA